MLFLAACGGGEGVIDDPKAKPVVDNSDTVVMSYEGNTIKSGMYAFIFSALKTNYLYLLQLYGDTDFVEDTETFWNMKADDGQTFAKSVTDDINNHCRMLLICKKMAEEYGVSLDVKAEEAVTDEYNDYVSSYGGEEELDVFLARYGIGTDELTEYLRMKQTISALRTKLCSAGGLCEVKDEDVYSEIDKRYVKVKHIYLLNSKYDGDALSKAEELLSQIESGEKKFDDFAGLSDDNAMSEYKDGFLVDLEETEENYASLAKGLEVGKSGVCKAENGAYLVTRCEMTEEDKKTKYDTVWGELADKSFSGVLENRYGQVELNGDELGKYDIITADTLQ